MTTTTQEPTLPDYVEQSQSKGAWRCTKGAIRRGRDGEEETYPNNAMLGYLKEINIWEGTTKDGQELARLLVRIKTNNGEEVVGAYIKNAEGKPGWTGLFGLATGVLYADLGEPIQISARQADKKNSKGSYSTYTNVARYDPLTGKLKPRETKPTWEFQPREYEWTDDGVAELLEDIQGHPAYKPYDYGAPYDFVKFCNENGWPIPKEVPGAYCELIGKALKREVEELASVTKEEWKAFCDTAMKKTECPKILIDAWGSKAAASKGKAEDEYDPFADE